MKTFVIHSVPLLTRHIVCLCHMIYKAIAQNCGCEYTGFFKTQLNLGLHIFCMWFYVPRLEFIDFSRENPDSIFKDCVAKEKAQDQRHRLISQETWNQRKISVDDAKFARLFVLLKTVTKLRKQMSSILICKVHILGKLIVM